MTLPKTIDIERSQVIQTAADIFIPAYLIFENMLSDEDIEKEGRASLNGSDVRPEYIILRSLKSFFEENEDIGFPV